MADLWQDEGFGSGAGLDQEFGEDDWDEGDESIGTDLEDGFDDPDEAQDDEAEDDDD